MYKVKYSAIFLLLSMTNVFADPYIPNGDDVVLTTLRSPENKIDRNHRKLAEALKRDPENIAMAIQLSKSYLQTSRITGDPRYASYAEATLGPWFKLDNPPEQALVIRATLKQFRHDFKGALTDLNKVLDKKPGNVQARITRSNINRVQGNYEAATRDCRALALRTDPLVVAICQSNITSVTGNAQWSYDNLAKLVTLRGDALPESVKNWALVTLAEIAEILGNSAKTEKHFLEAKAGKAIADMYLRSSYIDFLIDQKRFQDAYNLISENNPSDAMLLRKAIAAKYTDRKEYTELAGIIKSRFMDGAARGETGHLREESRFELHLENNPLRALKLAKQNWKTQRELWDTRLVLEAAIASEKYNEASEVITWIKKSKLEDKRILKLVSKIEGEKK